MKKHLKINAFTLCLLSLLLASCGGKMADKVISKSTSAPVTNAALESESKVTRSYHFIVNNCDTGEHQFSDSSSEKALQQMCDALQDNTLNNNCALYARSQYFSVLCEGEVWNPHS